MFKLPWEYTTKCDYYLTPMMVDRKKYNKVLYLGKNNFSD